MKDRALVLGLAVAAWVQAWPAATQAIDVVPHRAVYKMSLERSQSASGVTGAGGVMLFEWADSCDGWTIEQRYKLRMQYQESGESELSISFVTWESKDGLRYRFNVRKARGDDAPEELRGQAAMPASGGGEGEASFQRPDRTVLPLPPGTIFPTAHTLALIKAAAAGEGFLSRFVFDGGTVDGPFEVSAGIGTAQQGRASEEPVLRTRWWPIRMAFFPADSQSPQPEYELGLDLQDNGIARSLILDYGNFVIRARLDRVELLPKPNC